MLNPQHYTALHDLAQTHPIDIFALTETWVTPSTMAHLSEATPSGYTLISTPRPVSLANAHKKIVGGGTAFFLHTSLTLLSFSFKIFKSFELSSITVKTKIGH